MKPKIWRALKESWRDVLAEVFIGTLEVEIRIQGNGEVQLPGTGIQIARFDADLIPVLEN